MKWTPPFIPLALICLALAQGGCSSENEQGAASSSNAASINKAQEAGRASASAARTDGPFALPGDLRNSDVDPAIVSESSVVVTVMRDGKLYSGERQIGQAELKSETDKKMEAVREGKRVVYLRGDAAAAYGHVVDAVNMLSRLYLNQVCLVVDKKRPEGVAGTIPACLRILAPENMEEELQRAVRISPRMLTLIVRKDLSASLIRGGDPVIVPMIIDLTAENAVAEGSVNDLSAITAWLANEFKRRFEVGDFKPGFERRDDLPPGDRIEKSIFIKASRSTKYGDVVKVIDAVKGIGANPIVLQTSLLEP